MENTETKLTGKQKITFQQASMNWLALCEIRNKESTYRKYKNLLDSYILPEIGTVDLQTINSDTIVSFLKKQYLSGGVRKKGLSNSTIQGMRHVINAVFQYASRHKYMRKMDVKIDFLSPVYSKISVLTEEEENTLVRYLMEGLDLYKLGILVCLYTGIRIGELCALSWEDVNLLEGYIAINQSVQRLQTGKNAKKTRLHLDMPKSKSSVRAIPLPNFLVHILEKVRSENKNAVFVLSGTDKLTDPRTMQYKFSLYLKDLGIHHVNFHTLRHTFATRCVRIGFDVKTLSEILGHSNVNITLNRYVHSSIEMKRKQMQLVSSEWFGKMSISL